ncbi:hypothetical protein Mal4_22240 [Maioricimonas rarisocia]|uniref:DUF1570 domain-containing protein n=1 Tax=Maioricimonas rarisocia TaxID=2528026 RepID=A0A517Z622_9PLAN|nr:hypothetical protein [Maioricimonas rarisocia]QDU37905.1 hypothetical protein Mal4_22240 [Maioricimonas rarisocia]
MSEPAGLGPRRFLLSAAVIGATLLCLDGVSRNAVAGTAEALELLRQRHEARRTEFVSQLRALAGEVDESGDAARAHGLKRLALQVEQQSLDLDELPETYRGTAGTTDEFEEQLWHLQEEYAADVYLLSRRAVRGGFPSYAFHLVREVAHHDPDHRRARELLGYVRYGDTWTTPFAASMQRKNFQWHDRFGWLPASHVEKYEEGLRLFNGRWMDAETEARHRTDFDNAWEIPTEHFLIVTNHSLERGVELGQALEDFHRFFVRELAAFFNTPQQMQKLFDGGSAAVRGAGSRHIIHFYRNRQEFVLRLQRKQPNVAISNGLYLPSDRIAYFYHRPEDPQANMETMYHEVTHQLLGESVRRTPDVGRDADFWLVEGIACYMESFRRENGELTAGDPDHVRIYWAREYALRQDFIVPMQRLTQMGMREFRLGGDVATLQRYYAQSAGMTHFFMHYRDGIYREALIEHLARMYSPDARVRRRATTIAELAGVSFETLDQQYLEHLRTLDAMVDARDAAGPGEPAVP